MELKLILSKKSWSEFFPKLQKRDVEKFTDKSFKEKHIKRNSLIDKFYEFKKELRENKEISDETLVELPEEISLKKELFDSLNDQEEKYTLLELFNNNNKKFYYYLIGRLKNPHTYDETKSAHFSMAQSIFLNTKPLLIQRIFENLEQEYKHTETTEQRDQARYEFHKSLRQTDLLDNGHMESIMWNLLQISDAPFEIIENLVASKELNLK